MGTVIKRVPSEKLRNFCFAKTTPKKSINMPKGSGLTKTMKLSGDLADIGGKKEASRAECIKQLWAYIKKHNLQDPENKQFFVPDKTWQRFSEMIRSVLSEWPSFCLPICLKMNVSKKLSKPNYKIIQLFCFAMISHHELLCLPIAIFLTYNKPNKI